MAYNRNFWCNQGPPPPFQGTNFFFVSSALLWLPALLRIPGLMNVLSVPCFCRQDNCLSPSASFSKRYTAFYKHKLMDLQSFLFPIAKKISLSMFQLSQKCAYQNPFPRFSKLSSSFILCMINCNDLFGMCLYK